MLYTRINGIINNVTTRMSTVPYIGKITVNILLPEGRHYSFNDLASRIWSRSFSRDNQFFHIPHQLRCPHLLKLLRSHTQMHKQALLAMLSATSDIHPDQKRCSLFSYREHNATATAARFVSSALREASSVLRRFSAISCCSSVIFCFRSSCTRRSNIARFCLSCCRLDISFCSLQSSR